MTAIWVLVGIVVLVVLSKCLGSTGRASPTGMLPGPGEYEIEVVGESHYQDALASICGGRAEDGAEVHCQAVLVLEDDNEHDKKAVRVDIQGKTVGYLSRAMARSYRKRLKEAGHPNLTGTCNAVIRGGWDRGSGDVGNFGVWLDLPPE